MAIPPSQIEDDIAEGPECYESARLRVSSYESTAEIERTAPQCAEYLHAQMIQACAALVHPKVNPSVADHLVGVAARTVAQTALFSAGETGELGRLNQEMDCIREESGKEDFDELPEEELPPQYVKLAERAGEFLRRIEKMIMVDVLNRYRLREYAELIETDEAAFDARVREGYYVLFPEKRASSCPGSRDQPQTRR